MTPINNFVFFKICFCISDCPNTGLKSVPVNDPVVQEAAQHAVKTIQQRSNSLLPYELQEIVHANAEVFHHFFPLQFKRSHGLSMPHILESLHYYDLQ